MKIPDKIQILGCEIKTVYEQQYLEEQGLVAQSNIPFNEIRLRKINDGRKVKEAELFENYIHELTHFMMNKLGYKEMASDEVFIEGMSNILVQVIIQLEQK